MNWVRETKGACHLDFLVIRFAAADQKDEQVVDACDEVRYESGQLQQKQPRRAARTPTDSSCFQAGQVTFENPVIATCWRALHLTPSDQVVLTAANI